MSSDIISLGMDIVVLAFLGTTIFYVLRLTKSLNDFKAHRRAFDGVVADLLSTIDQAERSVTTLKQVSAKEAGELDDLISQSRLLADELRIINAAGESMAKRLEQAAEKNGKIAQNTQQNIRGLSDHRKAAAPRRAERSDKISSPVHSRDEGVSPRQVNKPQAVPARSENYQSTLKQVKKEDVSIETDIPSFMIQDRDFDDVSALGKRLDSAVSNDADDMPDHLQSQAERELFAALRNTKHNIKGGGTL